MNINIALNTIIYIMVFLFPGVLFRKFYFQGKHRHQFTSGNIFERFILTIVLSIFCIVTFVLFFEVFLSGYLKLQILKPIEYCEFVDIFRSLSSNKIPELANDKHKFYDLAKLFLVLYLWSIGFGQFLYSFIDRTKIDRFLTFLRFTNELDYLFYAPSKEISKGKSLKALSINIDVLTKYKDEEVLFQGDLYKVLYNKDHEFAGISIKNVCRFVSLSKEDDKDEIADIEESIKNEELRYNLYREYKNSIVYKREINSDTFVIEKDNIINYSIFYLQQNKESSKVKYFKMISATSLIVLFVSMIVFTVFPIIDISLSYFDTIFKRLIFSIYSIWQLIITLGALYNVITEKNIKDKITNLLLIPLFGIFYLWFFNVLSWVFVLAIFFVILLIMSFTLIKNEDKEENK